MDLPIPYRIGLLFRPRESETAYSLLFTPSNNADFGAIHSVTDRSCTTPISKVKRHISSCEQGIRTVAEVNRDLTKLLQRRQGERQKSNRFNEQNSNSARALRFFVHFFTVPAQLRRKIKWPNFKFTWERERRGDEFYHLCLNSGAVPSLQLQPKFPSSK